jgi:chitinase
MLPGVDTEHGLVHRLQKLLLLEKGKPPERVGRKATGLNPNGQGSGVPGMRGTVGIVPANCRPDFIPKRCQSMNSTAFLSKLTRIALPVIVMLSFFLVPLLAWAQQVTLAWDPNTDADLAGYKISYGTVSRNYSSTIDVQKATSYSVTGLSTGQTYYFAASAYNAEGLSSGYSSEVSYSIPAVNGAPGAPAVPSGPAGATVGATGSYTTAATDPNGDAVQYRYDWGNGVISAYGLQTQSYAWTAAGSYTVKAQARDSLGAESAWSGGLIVTVTAPNLPPVVSAGASRSVSPGAAVVLAATASAPLGIAGCQWRQVSGSTVALAGAQTLQASFTAPSIAAGTAILGFEFKATDAAGLSSTAACTVTVLSNDTDGDGIHNAEDAFATNPNEWHDTDGDGIGDNADTDDNNNGILDANEPVPSMPTLVSPIHESVVGPMAVLKSSAFHSPLTGVTHVQSRWQVFREDDDYCVLDIKSKTALTSLKVPKLILDEETRYFWRVQYMDSKVKASPWSDYGYFSTVNTGRDLNANGIPDAQEVAGTVDLDQDGVMDVAEPKIKAVKVEGTSTMIGVSVKGSATALGVESVESENPTLAGAYGSGKPGQMPFGLVNFKIAVSQPGAQTKVVLYFSQPAPLRSKWYKYDGVSGTWYNFSTYAKFSSDRRSITLTLKDGGPGDADGIANGVIVDPAGIIVGGLKKPPRASRR